MVGLFQNVGPKVLGDVGFVSSPETRLPRNLVGLASDQRLDILCGKRDMNRMNTHRLPPWAGGRGTWVSSEVGADRLRHPRKEKGCWISLRRHPTPSALRGQYAGESAISGCCKRIGRSNGRPSYSFVMSHGNPSRTSIAMRPLSIVSISSNRFTTCSLRMKSPDGISRGQ